MRPASYQIPCVCFIASARLVTCMTRPCETWSSVPRSIWSWSNPIGVLLWKAQSRFAHPCGHESIENWRRCQLLMLSLDLAYQNPRFTSESEPDLKPQLYLSTLSLCEETFPRRNRICSKVAQRGWCIPQFALMPSGMLYGSLHKEEVSGLIHNVDSSKKCVQQSARWIRVQVSRWVSCPEKTNHAVSDELWAIGLVLAKQSLQIRVPPVPSIAAAEPCSLLRDLLKPLHLWILLGDVIMFVFCTGFQWRVHAGSQGRSPQVVLTREKGKNATMAKMLDEKKISWLELPLVESVPGPDRYVSFA